MDVLVRTLGFVIVRGSLGWSGWVRPRVRRMWRSLFCVISWPCWAVRSRGPATPLTDRMLLASLARLLSRERWGAFLVTPATLLRWHRELVARRWTYPHIGGARKGLPEAAVEVVVRLARENPRWGYLRIVGEVRKLEVAVSGSSVRTILHRHGLGPAPARSRRGPSWVQFLLAQAG